LTLALALAAPGARADDAVRLRVGLLRVPASAPVFIAQDTGYFKRHGVAAELKFADVASDKDVDVGVAAFTPELMKLAAKGAIVFVAGAMREARGQPGAAYVAGNAAGLGKPKDLAGHSLALAGWEASFSLALLAEKYQLDAKTMKISTPALPAAALKAGEVDAALMPAALAKPLHESGEARLLGWVGDETPWPMGAVFVTAEANKRREDLARFLAAFREGARAYDDKLWVSAKRGSPLIDAHARPILELIERYTKLKPEEFASGLPYFDRDAMLDIAGVTKLVAWMQANKLMDAGGDAAKMIDSSYGFAR